MKQLHEVLPADSPAVADAAASVAVTLNYDQRRRSRQRLRLDTGEEVALHVPRGTVLRDGDRLRAEDGTIVAVRAAPEPLSSAETDDPLLLARAAYHLGNRHVPLQIAPGQLRYQHDHVLDELARGLGLEVQAALAPFQPEGGGYGHGARGAAGHGHDHAPHDHDHD